MSLSKFRALVSSTWLKDAIKSNVNLHLFEASWFPTERGQQMFIENHIPSARFFDMWKGVSPTVSMARDLPCPKQFEEYSQEKGINNDSEIIIYDRSSTFFSARLWFTFKVFGHEKVSVLNGGLQHWLQQGFPLESGDERSVKPGIYTVQKQQLDLVKRFDDMVKNVTEVREQVIDCRSEAYFCGEAEEPSPATVGALKSAGIDPPQTMKRGHVPHAVNIENSHFFDPETGCVLPKDELKRILAADSVDMEKPITSMCYNGISACVVPLALSTLSKDVSVYLGSWTEYGQRARDQHIETGEGSTVEPHTGPVTGG